MAKKSKQSDETCPRCGAAVRHDKRDVGKSLRWLCGSYIKGEETVLRCPE